MPQSSRFNFNEITVRILPNPQYTQLAVARTEPRVFTTMDVNSHQIEKLEIFKSLEDHGTQVRLMLDNMEHNFVSMLSEGKMIVYVAVGAFRNDQETVLHGNYFMCDDLEILGTSKVAGTYPSIKISIDLKSITRQRMEIENNLPFELGGKGAIASTGANIRPAQFYENFAGPLLTRNYSPNDYGASTQVFFNFSTAAFNKVDNAVNSYPTTGYKIEAQNNLDAIEYLFNNFPPVLSPSGWMLDDFPTGGQLSFNYSHIRCVNFVKYEAWRPFIDLDLSAYINRTLYSSDTGADDKDRDIEAYALINFTVKDVESFYNIGKFMFRDNGVKLFAQEMYSGNVLNMTEWNKSFNKVNVLTADATQARTKEILNPKYNHYVTFMSAVEIQNMQKYLNVFMNLKPELVTYTFNNLLVGDIDMDTVIELDPYIDPDYKTGSEKKRMGITYDIRHVYERSNPTPATQELSEGTEPVESKLIPVKFNLTTEVTMLQVEQGVNSLAGYNDIAFVDRYATQDITTSNVDLIQDACGNLIGDVGTNIDLDSIPEADPSVSSHRQTAVEAAKLVSEGYAYSRALRRLPQYMDCSEFTQTAIQRSGADAGRKTRYPSTTSTQYTWMLNPANGAMLVKSKDEVQPGDVIFFKSRTSNHGHTAIAKDANTYYHASSVKGKTVEQAWTRSYTAIFRLLPMTSEET